MKISKTDINNLKIIRKNVNDFIKDMSLKFDKNGTIVLDIAPQDYIGAAEHFKKSRVLTLDINPKSGADFIADICKTNSDIIEKNSLDFVVCTEVIEHVLNPFSAVKEISRILKKDGFLFLSTPFNFRIHGPLPDCWRFTEHGLKELLKDFSFVEIKSVENKKRALMPTHYTVIAKK